MMGFPVGEMLVAENERLAVRLRTVEAERNAAREEADSYGKSIQTFYAVLPGALLAIMVNEHTRWLDGATGPLPPETVWKAIEAEVARLAAEHPDGNIRLPAVVFAEEVIAAESRVEALEAALETIATAEDFVDEEDYQAFARAALAVSGNQPQ